MARPKLNKKLLRQIDRTVAFYKTKYEMFETLARQLQGNLLESPKLRELIHSAKMRAKDPEHLRDKLQRWANEAFENDKPFETGPANLFVEVEDLAGVRLLHLHTKQMREINPAIREMLKEHRYTLLGKPVAYTWDFENEEFFKGLGFKTKRDQSLYTSVHYYIEASRRTRMRCELQVRTLAEELWGEVSHAISYPYESRSVHCREQLKVLARIASGNTRLVDSIFVSHAEQSRLEGYGRKTRGGRGRVP